MTPPPPCKHGNDGAGQHVAALYIDPRGPYPKLLGPEMCWDEKRDARTYAGPWPVVAHPPCGPWGRLRHMYKGAEHELAPLAVEQVRKWGGILEHPWGSLLWKHCGLPRASTSMDHQMDRFGGFTLDVKQVSWGHVAEKRTWLYFVGIDQYLALRERHWGGTPTHHVSRDAKRARRNGYTLKRTSSKQNRETPIAFAEWLISLAQTARRPT